MNCTMMGRGETDVRYGEVVDTAGRVAATPKRSEKVALFADLLRRVQPDEIAVVIGMLVGEPRQGRIGVGWARLRDARVQPADECSVTVGEVDAAVEEIARTSGLGSQRGREAVLTALLARMTADEQHHFVRMLTGEMRQGATEGVVSDAVAKAAAFRQRTCGGRRCSSARSLRPRASAHRRTTRRRADTARRRPADARRDVGVRIGGRWRRPDRRASSGSSTGSGCRRTSAAATSGCSRAAQRHHCRAAERQPMRSARSRSDSIVLDGESLAIDEAGRPRRFQDTMSGLDTTSAFFFDVLHVDATSLIDDPLRDRKRVLADVVPARLLLPSIETDDGEEADRFALAATSAGHEGVMVKGLESTYQAGRRGSTWRKVKPVLTLDLVVLAAEWGHGRRAGWLSNLHLGAKADDGSGFVMVGKTFKGMTDELLRWQTQELQTIAIGQGESDGAPTVFVRPERVVEIAIDGVQVSRRYPGRRRAPVRASEALPARQAASEADTIERVRSFLL
jgi:DNA ligase-1